MLVDRTTIALLWSRYAGSTTSVNDLVLGLDKSRFAVMFIYLCGRGAGEDLFEKAGYEVFYLRRRRRMPFLSPGTLLKLARVLKQRRVHILHCHTHSPAVYGAVATALARTPVLLTHVHGLNRTRKLRRRLTNLFVFRRAARVICAAQGVRKDVIRTNWRVDPDKVLVLENSVDYERFASVDTPRQQARSKLGLSADDFVFGTVGRLVPTKGLRYLLDAFSIVKRQVPSAQLVLLGEGSSRADLERQAAESPCPQAIHFLGYRAEIAEVFRGLDVFVLSSLAEGMPRALLEAMAAGVPCVATEVGGIPEVINDAGVGFLAPPRDAAALARRMVQVARMSGPERAAIRAAAQQRIRRFYSHDVIREKLGRIYEEEYENYRARARGEAGKAAQKYRTSP